MSDPNEVWQQSNNGNGNSGSGGGDYRMEDRSPRRDRSRSPARNGGGGGGGGGDDRGRNENQGNQGNNLHVSGLARTIDQQFLEDIFGKIGKVKKVQIMTDPHTQESRGFGFVEMVSGDDAAAAIEQLNGTMQEGKNMTVAMARRGRARTPTPGRYHGVKLESRGGYGGGYGGGGGGYDRPYQPRSYDSRYSDRGPPRYDDRRYDDRRYDDRRDDRRYDDRRYDDRRDYGGGRDRYDDYRSGPPREDYRDSRGGGGGGGGGGYDRRDDRPRYDERPRY